MGGIYGKGEYRTLSKDIGIKIFVHVSIRSYHHNHKVPPATHKFFKTRKRQMTTKLSKRNAH
jgi:hypothetical protein